MTNLKTKFLTNFTVSRIAILGFLVAIIVTLKWSLKFIPGIELVSFCFITFTLFLPTFDLFLLISSFNLIVLVTHGIGMWWVAYWILWPLICLLSKFASSITKNKYIFGLIGFFTGPIVMIVYFFSDMIFFDSSYAIANLITAIPINMIEGIITMIAIILISPKILKIISRIGNNFWTNKKYFLFKENKYKLLNIFTTIFTLIISTIGIVFLFIYNSFFIKWKYNETRQEFSSVGHIQENSKIPNNWNALTTTEYNNLYDQLGNHQVGIAIIANNNSINEVIDIYENASLESTLKNIKQFNFKLINTYLGKFVGSYFLNNNPKQLLHGQSSSKNYNDYYPMILLNHKYLDFGISHTLLHYKDIIEFTYDHNA